MPSLNTSSDFTAMRRAMIDSQLRPNAVEDKWILSAMGSIAREDFVPAEFRNIAYMDRSISLGNDRYLAPPLTSAHMLQKADIQPSDTILYIGAGSGYNVQIAADRAKSIVAIDPDIDIIASAANITAVKGALSQGAPNQAPYSLVIIEGAVDQVPQEIIDQMSYGGRLICGLMDGKVSHLCIGYKRNETLAIVSFMDCEIEKFTSQTAEGFEKIEEFSF